MLENIHSGLKLSTPYFFQWKVDNPHGGQPYKLDFAFPKLKVGFECLPPWAAVSTTSGTIRAEDVMPGMKVLDRHGNPTTVINNFARSYDDEILSIKALGIRPIEVTPEHKLLISKPRQTRVKRHEPRISRTREYVTFSTPEFVQAKEISTGDFLLLPKLVRPTVSEIDLSHWNGKANNAKKVSKQKLDIPFARFCGFYVAEGSIGNSGSIEFSFHAEEKEYIEEIVSFAANRLNSTTSVRIKENSAKVVLCHTAMSRFLAAEFGCGATNKHIGEFVFSSSESFRMSFIEAMSDGDGCRRPNGTLRVITSSETLAMQTQLLAGSLGKFSPISKSRGVGLYSICGRTGVQNALYEVGIPCKNPKPIFKEDKDYFYVPVRAITRRRHTGMVYNFETEDHAYSLGNIVSKNCDGSVWHSNPQQVQHDRERDYQLAMRGWTIVRFDDKTIEDSPDAVQNVVVSYIKKSMHHRPKQASLSIQAVDCSYFTAYAGSLIDVYGESLPEELVSKVIPEDEEGQDELD